LHCTGIRSLISTKLGMVIHVVSGIIPSVVQPLWAIKNFAVNDPHWG